MRYIILIAISIVSSLVYSQSEIGFGSSNSTKAVEKIEENDNTIIEETKTTVIKSGNSTLNNAVEETKTTIYDNDNSSSSNISFGSTPSKTAVSTPTNVVDAATYSTNPNSNTIDDYRVQVFLSKKPSFPKKYLINRSVDMIRANGYYVFNVNGFSNDVEAFQYAQDLRRKGVEGAFVTRYMNGYRDYSYSYNISAGYNRIKTNNSLNYPTHSPKAYE